MKEKMICPMCSELEMEICDENLRFCENCFLQWWPKIDLFFLNEKAYSREEFERSLKMKAFE